MQFKAMHSEVEVNGETVASVLAGMGAAKALAARFLTKNGLGDPRPGQWYPQQKWLDAFKDIAESVGPNTLFKIGQSIPQSARFPPEIQTIEHALAAIDVAYHMNHRLGGVPLFDGKTRAMREGIGHYTFTATAPTRGRVVCQNPYPCDFDRGIIEAMATRFKAPGASVSLSHDEHAGCRKNGGDACTYLLAW